MNFRRWMLVLGMPALLAVSFCQLQGVTFFIRNGQAIAANGEKGAYLITALNELLEWNDVMGEWTRIMTLTPAIRQMDCLSDTTHLMGTDKNDKIWLWNGVIDPGGSWSKPRGDTEYSWFKFDHVTDEAKGLRKGLGGAWEAWDAPTDPQWSRYIPAGPEGAQRLKTLLLVDTKSPEFHRWQRGDTGYRMALNMSGETTPFKIFAYTENTQFVLDRMSGPQDKYDYLDPAETVINPDLVLARQISYDETEQNLWCIDHEGKPWYWNNEYQGWELRDIRSDIPPPECVGCCYDDIAKLLRVQDDYYVRTTYIAGDYRPVVIIFKDTMVMHLIVGELSRGDLRDAAIYVFEAKPRAHNFHHILQLPRERPQKLVRLDGVNRIRENHYLERLFIQNDIIPNHEALGVYPAEHRLIRR